jgi:hypothetical protein
MNKRKWWRAAAVLALGGAAAATGFGLAAKAEPPRLVNGENVVWSRSSPVTPAPAPAPVAAPAVSVVPASAVEPVAPIPLPAQTAPPPIARPRLPAVVSPEFKAVPAIPPAPSIPPSDAGPMPVVPSPLLFPIPRPDPAAPPLAAKSSPVAPAAPAVDPVPPVPVPAYPIVKPDPAAPPLAPKPKAVVPPIPGIPPAGPIAPPAPSLKSADADKPIPPAAPDFNLRPGDAGNSVKPKGTDAVPVEPPLRVEVPRSASSTRPKPIDGPMPATEKYTFPIPRPKPSGQAVPTALAKPPAAKPSRNFALPSIPIVPALPPTPGVNTMNSKQIAMATVLGGAMGMVATTASPAPALPLPPKPITPMIAPTLPANSVKLDADSDVKALRKDLETANREIKRLTELLEGLKDQPSEPGALRELTRLKDKVHEQGERIAALEKELLAMKNSTSLKPTTQGPAPALTGKGIVRVINEYPVEVTILINDKTHRVAPNTSSDVPVPVGEFTYQLISSGAFLAPVRGPIGEKEVVKLRIK